MLQHHYVEMTLYMTSSKNAVYRYLTKAFQKEKRDIAENNANFRSVW